MCGSSRVVWAGCDGCPSASELAERIQLPSNGAISTMVVDRRRPGVLFPLESWTRSRLWYQYTPGQRQPSDTRLVAPARVDVCGLRIGRDRSAEPRRGEGAPLHRVPEGHSRRTGQSSAACWMVTAPTASPSDPSFSPTAGWPGSSAGESLRWRTCGAGGGEDWHQAGQKATKPNTWKDFITCAEYLVKAGYTSPEHLAGTGTSAGGILIGRAITERPDLFRAAVPRVGAMNALRAEHEPGWTGQHPRVRHRDKAG